MGDDEFVPERVLGKRISCTTVETQSTEYLVKWKDFDHPDDYTWEPEKNLEGNENLVGEYERSSVVSRSGSLSNLNDSGLAMTPKIPKLAQKRKSPGQDDEASTAKRSKSLPTKLTQPDSSTEEQNPRDKENVAPTSSDDDSFIDPKEILSKRNVSLKFKWENGKVSDYIPLQQAKVDHPQLIKNFIEKFHKIANWRVYMKILDGSENAAANGEDEVVEVMFR